VTAEWKWSLLKTPQMTSAAFFIEAHLVEQEVHELSHCGIQHVAQLV
jgi:hypothetical protein